MLRVLDAHLHFLDVDRFEYPWMRHPDHERLRRSYLPADFARDLGDGIELVGAVHVQGEVDHAADPVLETEWIAELAAAGEPPLPTACIPYADLLGTDLELVLDRHTAHPIVRGIRQEAWCDPASDRAEFLATDILALPAFERGLRTLARRDLCFDLLVFPYQLLAAGELFARVADLRVVLEHTGVPSPTREGLESWRDGMRRFARAVPEAMLKVSAMGFIRPDWTVRDIRPIVREAIEIFGPERCMFASNFPVERQARDYAGVWSAFSAVTADLSEREREGLFVANAQRFYRL